jgi:hypothetical protein
MTTIASLRTRLKDYTRDKNKIRPQTMEDRALNKGYEKVQADLWWSASASDALYDTSTVSGIELYTLPSDFVRLKIITLDGQQLTQTTREATRSMWTISSGTPNTYYLYAWAIGLYPVPDKVMAISMENSNKLAKLSDSQDSELPESTDDAVTLYAAYKLFLWVRDAGSAGLLRQDYEEEMKSVRGMLLFNDDNISYWYSR